MKKISSFVACCILVVFSAQALAPFNIDLQRGDVHPDVLRLQQYLNSTGFSLAVSGPGSSGNETRYFGPRTQRALIRFQNHYKAEILTPLRLLIGTGNFFTSTRNFINKLIRDAQTPTPTPQIPENTPVTPPQTPEEVITTITTPAFTQYSSGGSRTIADATIEFEDTTKSYSETPFVLDFTSNSNGAVVFTSSNPAIASISGSTVTMHNIGSVTVTATQAATGTYKGSVSTMTLTINDVNRCLEGPCLHGALCNRVVPASYTCTCAVGFSGPTCATPVYSIGGTVSGLTGEAILQNNGGDSLSVTSNGAFSFSNLLESAATYIVSVFSQPENQTCILTNATGTVSGSNITNIILNCILRPNISGFPNITNNAATGIPTYTLATPTSNSAGTFSYSIENESIGTIDGNLLTIHGIGTTTLTATQAANGIYGVGTINATLTIGVVDACSTNPCGSHGTCTRTRSVPGGFLDSYSCSCESGYYGTNCNLIDSSANACLADPCLNGGSCSRSSSTPGGPLDTYTCSCPSGFTGVNCEMSDSVCSEVGYCLNGGTCNASPAGGECSCPTCWTGDRCQMFDAEVCA